MELVITPDICKPQKDEAGVEKPALFSGTVKIKLPTMPESYRFKAKYGRRTMGLGAEGLSKEDSTMLTMELLADIADQIKPNFIEVCLIENESKKEISSVDELYSYEPVFAVVSEIAMMFVQGFAQKN